MASARRTALGMRDWDKELIKLRENVIATCKKFYRARGASELDTPVLEQFELVKDLYGEEFNKSVYLLDDGDLIMRYDLTVPFARYITMNGLKLFRRYQIGKVYRRDLPELSKGRYTEITQADFDIVGSDQNSGIFDMEILELASKLIGALVGDNFIIRLNDRNILFQYLLQMRIPEDKLLTVSATIDKLDKKSPKEICVELAEKKIAPEIIGRIEKFICSIARILDSREKIIAFLEEKYPIEISTILTNVSKLESVGEIFHELKRNRLNEMLVHVKRVDNSHKIAMGPIMLNYLRSEGLIAEKIFNEFMLMLNRVSKLSIPNVMFDPLLTRGLDYYTGFIFEGYHNDREIMPSSICAGGRYDNLIGKLATNGDYPAVGMSVGIERIITILSDEKELKEAPPSIQIYVASISSKDEKEQMNMVDERIKLCNEFRNHNIPTMMSHLMCPKMGSQMEDVHNNHIPFMIVIGSTEIKNKMIRIKNMNKGVADNNLDLPREEGIKYLIARINGAASL
ncbi:MAG: histidine--tRNA synthetase [Hyperionvirus sp.]|uniref:histidine--tRNA ligase n=1 Tax=Hyperionvirus sp. TaxID=2487770 RepID=A0A3G5ABB8_9VIRU|nr:MAG: histidine--tRNA synthetase [Hyperionvirus sp.]